jgi:putative acetyltransferase
MEEANITLKLYQKVATRGGGIARVFTDAAQDNYTQGFIDSKKPGKQLVIEARNTDGKIIAELYCFSPSSKAFSHVLSDLTIVVAFGNNDKGLEAKIFAHLLEHIENSRPDILRVELLAGEENTSLLALYKELGFEMEGRFAKRICNSQEQFEAEIPMVWFNAKYIQP